MTLHADAASIPFRESSARPAADLFATEHLHKDLRGRSVRGGAATLGGQAATFALRLLSTAVLARLLTPADFGLIAMVTAVTGFVELFKDAGLSMATVQRDEITHRQVSTLFWVNVALSVVLMLITAALAPTLAWFYSEPRLIWVTVALAGTFLFGGLTVQHQALLIRQMRFATLSGVQVASQAVGVLVAISAAAAGLTYWALVLMTAATAATNAALVWIVSPWFPGLPSRGAGVRPLLAFGGGFSGYSFANYWTRNADQLLIGWYWGAAALGYYSRAYALMLLPTGQIKGPLATVVLPALSRLQSRPGDFARYYLRVVNGMMWMSAPVIALLAACSQPVILIVLGDQWISAASVFKVLALSALFQPIYSTIAWVYVSSGRMKRLLRWSAVVCPVMIASFVAALPFGPIGVAVAYATVFLLLLPWSIRYAFHGTALTTVDLLRAIAIPLSVSLVVFLAASLAARMAGPSSPWVELIVSSGAGALATGACILLMPRVREEFSRLLSLVKLSAFSRLSKCN